MRGEFLEKEGRGICTAPELDLEHEKLGFECILILLFFNYASFDSETINPVMLVAYIYKNDAFAEEEDMYMNFEELTTEINGS